jgi:hypothetical protein
MSRSHKKHCGSSVFGGFCRDKWWRNAWHSAMRSKERDMLILQMKYPEDDFCYPIPREVDDIYAAPSDGGSHWSYSGFEHYYFEETHPNYGYIWRWRIPLDVPTREEAWKKWVTEMIGK